MSNQLVTIGYGGRNPESMTKMLKEAGVTQLVDVRISPRTRVPGFSKQSMADWLPRTAGVEYRHEQNLGNANYQGEGPPVLVDEKIGLNALWAAMQMLPEGGNLAIMCACKKLDGCHREYIVQQFSTQHPDVEVVHLE